MPGRSASALNLLKAWSLLLALAAVLGALGWALGGVRVGLLFIFCVLLGAVGLWTYADRVVLGMVGARELLPGEAPALHSTVEALAARAQVVKPRLYLLADGFPRALPAGRRPLGSAIAVSTGLLSAASPAELEGVVAHELAHVRNRDVFLQTSAAVIAMLIVEASRIGGWLERSLLFVLAPVAAAFVHVLLSPKREFVADRTAAALCRSPHGLADALVRLEQAMELVEFSASPATEPLYTVNPFADQGLAALFVTHPPIGERVRRLRELDPDWRERIKAA